MFSLWEDVSCDTTMQTWPSGGMVYATDLKSVARKGVRVRVPPWPPTLSLP